MIVSDSPREVLSLWHGRMVVGRTWHGRAGRTIAEIADDVARRHGVSVGDLKSPARYRHIVRARQEAMYLAYQERRPDGRRVYSLLQIGRWFGGRDHTTALFGVRRHEGRLAAEPRP